MQKYPLSLILSCALVCAWPAFADTVVLNSGEKVEGKILSETPSEYTIEYKESAGIVDQRTIKKTDVKEIVKADPDEAAWEAIKGMKLGQYSLSSAQYEDALKRLNTFLNTYTISKHAAEVKALIDSFEAEKKRVDGGEVKIADKWLTKEQAQKESYQINGTLTFNYMKSQGAAGDLTGAMNTFEKLEKSFSGAKVYPDAVEYAKQVLPAINGNIERILQNLKTEAQGRTTSSQRADLEAAAAREDAAGEAAVNAAERSGLKWAALQSRSPKGLTAVQKKIAPELQRLAAVPVAKMRQSIALSEKARGQFEAKKFEEATVTLNDAKSAWDANEIAKRLETELNAAKSIAAAEPKPEDAPKPEEKPAVPSKVEKPAGASDEAAVVDDQEKPKPFLLTPVGGVTIVLGIILLLVASNVYKKLKGRANDVLE